MNESDALQILQSSLLSIIMISGPIVLPAMAVGIVIAFLQALTQIQESTLTFVPKMVVVFFSVLLSASYVGAQLQIMTEQLYERIATGF
jgi:flagellar biosynthetic protein FliQ